MAKRKNKLADKKKPDTHPELDGFTIEINKLGEITYSHDINAINEFLENNQEWSVVYQVKFNHGLVVLEKTKK